MNNTTDSRLHSLDAVRGFALLLGVAFHAALSFMPGWPPGIWAMNDNSPSQFLSDAAFGTAVTAGTLTVNGEQVTIATDDTLQEVFDKISTTTSGAVTGAYDNATDKVTLSSASPIVLGSATDTSNFFAAAKLYNNGTGSVASSFALGVVRTSATLEDATLN